jgi:hypothetical protein
MSRMRTTLAALAAATLALSACGGASSGGTTTLTRAQFIAKTDALCKASNTRTRALNAEVQRAGASPASDKQLLARLAPILARGYGQVRDNAAAFEAVDPPAGDKAKIELLRKLYDTQAELASKLAAAAKARDVQQFQTLSTQQDDILARARDRAQAYGFKECGSTKSDAA